MASGEAGRAGAGIDARRPIAQCQKVIAGATGSRLTWTSANPAGLEFGTTAPGPSGLDDAYTRLAERIAWAEQANQGHGYEDAVSALRDIPSSLLTMAHPSLRARALLAESWARMYLGELHDAESLAERARAVAEAPACTEIDRAQALYHLGCCRCKLSQIGSAVSVLTLALELCDRSPLPCDRLRTHILEWRSRSYQRQRDFDSARADIERALELAQGIDDEHSVAHVYFQASLVAERSKQWLVARFYAEQAKEIYERRGDHPNVGRLLNNLGGLHFLLGDNEAAVSHLKDAVRVSFEAGNDADAAQAISSLAQVHLRTGELALAEEQARLALEQLEGREDYLDEIGNAQLVLGRALLERGRPDEATELFQAAEESFERLTSISHRAAAWMAQGELASRGGDKDAAVELYRRAAEALQDFHF